MAGNASGPDDGTEPSRDGLEEERDRFPVDLADEEGEENGDEIDDAVGPEPSSAVVEPGDPSLENAVFVLLGAVAMTLVLVRILFLLA